MYNNRIDFVKLAKITFEEADEDTFRGLALAKQSSRTGGSMPTVFNAANEKAVALFLDNKIRFLQIYELIEACMDAHKVIMDPTVDQILMAEQECYDYIDSMLK